ncbi:MAG TPA: TIGR04053 family radical SAM/SPASM domain-containing protein [Candidatus Limnocylindrales bacterium]
MVETQPLPTGRPAGHPGAGHPGHPTALPGVGAVKPRGLVYDRAPMLVYWETTLACGLACRHCRATAAPDRSPLELSTEEGLRLLDRIVGFGPPLPHVVFTGGDPLRRPDLETLVRAATERGIGASLAPAVTPDLTKERLASLRDAGIQTISLSLDGSSPERHDGLRGVPGTFDLTMVAADWAREVGLPIQVNTLVTDTTLDDLPAVYELLKDQGILRWSLFFLISVGRGSVLQEVTPAESERLGSWLYELAQEAPFQIKTTEATHYRRIAIKRMEAAGLDEAAIARTSVGRGFGIRDGNGIMFVSFDGKVYPSGFLPLAVGDVRHDDVVSVYRDHPVFRELRDTSLFKGRCGLCPYVERCGGSRARAYAWTGDHLEADPLCPFVPSGATAARPDPTGDVIPTWRSAEADAPTPPVA